MSNININQNNPTTGSSGPLVPEDQGTTGGVLETFFQSLQGVHGETSLTDEQIKALQGVSDQISTGQLSKAQIAELKKISLEFLIDNPSLTPVNQTLVLQFNTRLSALLIKKASTDEGSPDGGILPVGENSWFDESATLDLFIVLSKMAAVLAQVAREQSLIDIALTNIMMSMAKDLSDLAKAMGDVAANKLMADATKSIIEGTMAIASIVMSAVTIAYQAGKIEQEKQQAIANRKNEILNNPKTPEERTIQKSYEALKDDPENNTEEKLQQAQAKFRATNKELDQEAQLGQKEMMQIQTKVVQTEVAAFKEIYQGLIGMTKSFGSAAIDMYKADLEKQQASMESTRTMLDKLFEVISKTERKVDSDAEGTRRTIADMLAKLREIIQLQGKFWSQGLSG